MSATELETVLARLYTQRPFLEQFLQDPEQALRGMDLSAQERHSLKHIDRDGLLLAVGSYERKRAASGAGQPRKERATRWRLRLFSRLRHWLRR
jgi:hypothetical protein